MRSNETTMVVGTVLALMAGVAVAAAQTNSNAAAAPASNAVPKVEFASTTFNFGRLKSGESVKHNFFFTNTGTATLEIPEVKPGCGCTAAGAWDKRVEPGKTGVIPMQFNSTGYGGPVAKSVTVFCNDPAHTNVLLHIAGTVWKPIDVTPQMAMFNISAEAPTNEVKVLRIVSNLEEPLAINDVKCSSPLFKTELKETKPGKEFELAVSVAPPYTTPTVFASITLKTSSTNTPMLILNAYAVVQQPVVVAPLVVALPPAPLSMALNPTVLVRNNGTNALTISEVKLDVPGVDVVVTEPQTGKVYSIVMKFPAGFRMPGGQKAELTFKSSHPWYPLLKVPVIQVPPPTPPVAAVASGSGSNSAVRPTVAPAAGQPSQLRTSTPMPSSALK